MLVLQKNPLPVEQKLEMYLSNSTLPTYLSHSNSVIFRMVPESTSMEMEQNEGSGNSSDSVNRLFLHRFQHSSSSVEILEKGNQCTSGTHSSDSQVQKQKPRWFNRISCYRPSSWCFSYRFQHSSSSVEILEKEKPMHIKVLVHSSDSILQQKYRELLLQNFATQGLFKVQGTGCRSKNQGIYWFWYMFDLNTFTKRDGVDVSGKQVYISAPESITVNPPEETQVFSFTGSKPETTTGRATSASVTKELRSHTGTRRFLQTCWSTRIYTLVGAAESRGVSPDSTWGKYSSRFRVLEKNPEAEFTLEQGRVFGFTGGAEATAVTENVPGSLFKLTGTVEVLFQRTPFIGSAVTEKCTRFSLQTYWYCQSSLQELFSFTGSTETTAVVPPVATLFEFNGNSAESRTRPYRGSGTLVTFQSATLARRVPYNATQGLFKLAGALRESFVPSGYVGTTGVQFIGASADEELNLNHRNQLRYTSFKAAKQFYRIPL